MRKKYWSLMLVAMLLVSLFSGCSVFKPAETIVQDAEEVKTLEAQVDSEDSITGAEAEGEDSDGTAKGDAANGMTDLTEANSSAVETTVDQAPDAQISTSKGEGTPAASVGSGTIGSEGSDTGSDSAAEANDGGTSPVAPSMPTLITKSENAVTEAERVELFNTIGFELEELIRLLDSLDTVQESDLNLDEFEE